MNDEATYDGAFLPWESIPSLVDPDAGPDDRSGAVYLEDAKLKLATEAALVTGRPLLIRGEPGSGKSSFAPFVARNLGWRYYEMAVTGRTEAQDMLWSFDALARIRDAQAHVPREEMVPENYVTPGVLWWAFNRSDALGFVRTERDREPLHEINENRDAERTVVLIDEIDKADTDVPNDLLEVFGQNRFTVAELKRSVVRKRPDENGNHPWNKFSSLLIILTTNRERDLPLAFERRCLVHTLQEPEKGNEQIERLLRIAELHLPNAKQGAEHAVQSAEQDAEQDRFQDGGLYWQIASKTVDLRQQAAEKFVRGPSTAEFLDAVKTCEALNIGVASRWWNDVVRGILIKSADWT